MTNKPAFWPRQGGSTSESALNATIRRVKVHTALTFGTQAQRGSNFKVNVGTGHLFLLGRKHIPWVLTTACALRTHEYCVTVILNPESPLCYFPVVPQFPAKLVEERFCSLV
ncbi:hypothetical protein C8R45DRAFT_1079834 [Mycena sanguinolenta]|nr:hypothetical protein C8R45DRAFT_1079834 [Mycena sanguinolenta]